jgi:DnaA-homolog protein
MLMTCTLDMKQIPLAIGLDPSPSFDSFVAGENLAALEFISGPTLPGTQIYLWGNSGSGKSHLLRAWASDLQQRGSRVGWFEAGSELPWLLQPDWALVVLDRCDELNADEQRAAFSLFVEAAEHRVCFAAAGRLPPVDLQLRDDLRSRLGWGHVFALHCLGEADARAALRREADRRGIFLSDEVMAFVLRRFSRDLKDMLALLDVMDRYALAQGRAITVPLLRKMLADDDELEAPLP